MADPLTEATFHLVSDPDAITHLVCCRDISWRVAFCGAQETNVNPAAEVICTMCVEAVRSMAPGFDFDARVCPVDATSCPSEYEVDLRMARETEK